MSLYGLYEIIWLYKRYEFINKSQEYNQLLSREFNSYPRGVLKLETKSVLTGNI